MRTLLNGAIAAVLISLASMAFALDISEAKNRGWVGEQLDGYLGLVNSSVPAEARKLVADINQQRRASYQSIAQKNQLPLATVEQLAAKKAIEKTERGHFVQTAAGWTRK